MIVNIEIEVIRLLNILRENTKSERNLKISEKRLKDFLRLGDERGCVASTSSRTLSKSMLPKGVGILDFLSMMIACEGYSFNERNMKWEVENSSVYSNAWFILEKLAVTSCSDWLPQLMATRNARGYQGTQESDVLSPIDSSTLSNRSSNNNETRMINVQPSRVFKLAEKVSSYRTFEEMMIVASSYNHDMEQLFQHM